MDKRPKSGKERAVSMGKTLLERYSSIIVLLVMVLLASFISDVFFTSGNLLNVLRQVSANGILSIGLLMVIITGGIDISIGSVVGITSVFFAALYDPEAAVGPFRGLIGLLSRLVPPGQAGLIVPIVILMIFGGLWGLFNGLIICKAKVQPFIMTIGTLTLYRGVALLISNGKPIYMSPETAEKVQFLGDGRIFLGIPTQVVVLAAVGIVMAFLLNKTIFGRYIKAIGGSQESARVAGINVNKYKTWAYVLCGTLASVAGILLTARTTTGDPTLGESFEMNAIAACVIGGAKLTGGVGTIGGTVIGAIIIGIINNILNLANISTYYQYVVRGGIIILAVVFNSMERKK